MVAACCCAIEVKPIDKEPRGCTDYSCCCLFTLCLIAQGSLIAYGFQNGDPSRFFGFPNHRGEFCGISEYVAEKPYLYFCQDAAGRLNWTAPICVESCPDPPPGEPAEQRECPFGMSTDYPTESYMGEVCVPKNLQRTVEIDDWIWARRSINWLMQLGELMRAWQVLAIAAVISIMLAFSYLFFLEVLTFYLLWAGIVMLVTIPALVGGFAIYASQHDGTDRLPSTGDSVYDLWIGLGMCFLSAVFLCVAFFAADSVNLAIECIKATCECIRDMPTVLFEPIVGLFVKVPTLIGLMAGFLYLGSCITEVADMVWTESGLVEVVDVIYSPDVYWFMGFYIFMSVWIMEFFTALSHFAIAYAAQQWYFSHHRPDFGLDRGAPTCAACKGLVVGLIYHTGTLAFGSIIISLSRPLRWTVGWLTQAAECAGCCNPLVKAANSVFACCIACFERFLQFLGKTPYIDVAVNGSDFCRAAHNTFLVLHSEFASVAVLSGSTWLFQLTGLGGVALGGAYIAFLMTTHIYVYADPVSKFFIEDPLFLTGVAFLICLLVALPFMVVLDDVSDAILFCHGLEEQRNRRAGNGELQELSKDRPETQALLRRAREPGAAVA